MRVINVSLSELETKVLLIGFEGENQITQVRIDAAEILTDHPNATPTLIAKPLFGFAYPVIVTKEGTDVVWEIDNSVLSFHGDGEIQLTFTEGTVIAKSYVGRIRIKRSLAVNGEKPDPIETWEQAATAKLAEVDAQIGELEDMVEAAEAAKDQAQDIVDDAAADIQAAGAAQVQVVQAAGEEVLDSIPADYTELSDEVTGLKSAFNSTMSAISDGSSDIYWSSDTKFYDGYYNGTPAYTGTGTEGQTKGWGVIVLHVKMGETITISNMPNSGGVASVWLNSSSPSDVAIKAWNSNQNNGSHLCLTDWLAVADSNINYNNVVVKYPTTDIINRQIDKQQSQLDSIGSFGYQYANKLTAESGKRYGGGTIAPITDSTNPYYLYQPFIVPAGKYYFLNLFYPYSNYLESDGSISTFSAQNGYIEFDDTTILYLTGYGTYGDLLFANKPVPNSYVYGYYGTELDNSIITFDETVRKTSEPVDGASIANTLGINAFQFLNDADFDNGHYYNGGAKTKSAAEGYVCVQVNNLSSGKYYFRNVYSDFTNIENIETGAITKLSTLKNSGRISGDVTINYNYNLYLSFHSDFDTLYYGKTVWCNAPYTKLLSDRTYGTYFIRMDSRKYASEEHPVFTVETDGTGDFDSVKEAIETAVNYPGAVVKIGSGTFDLIDEFGSDYFANLGTVQNAGLRLYNDIIVEGTSATLITCNYTGSNNNVMLNFSPFNIIKNKGVYGGMTLKNIRIECSNVRYAVHDEALGHENPYTNKYIRCDMKIDNRNNTAFSGRACIGGGLGAYGTIVVQDSVFESVTDGNTGTGIVSYHNGDNANAKNKVIISNNYFKGKDTARVSWSGSSTIMSTAYISNNSMGMAPYCEAEGGSTNVNMEMIAWNNEIRQ